MRLILITLTACFALAGSLALFGPLGTAYGALCAVCFWLVWREPEWRWAGTALAVNWFISNLIVVIGYPADRPPIYSGAEIIVIMSAFTCWFAGSAVGAARALAVVSFISIVCNIILAGSTFTWADIHAHELRTNIAFAIECLIVGAVGAYDRGYIRRLLHRRSDPVANHVHIQKAND